MRTFFTILIFSFFLSPACSKVIKVAGTYTDFRNKQEKGEFLIPVQYLNVKIVYRLVQWRVLFKDEAGIEYLLTPMNCQGFDLFFKDQWVRFVSVENAYQWRNPFGDRNTRVFMEVEVEGQLSLLSYYGYAYSEGIYLEDGSGGTDTRYNGFGRVKAHLFFYKDNRLIKFNRSGWKKQLFNLIWREEDYAQRVKGLRKRELPEFLSAYNDSVNIPEL